MSAEDLRTEESAAGDPAAENPVGSQELSAAELQAPGEAETSAGDDDVVRADPQKSAQEAGSEDGEDAPDEGDIAADYIEELLDIYDLDGDIDIEVRNGRTYISLVTETPDSLDHLVGQDGEVLEALQELTRLAVLAETGERSRLVLDIAGHRVQHGNRLRRIALEAVERVNKGAESVALAPMSAYERKQVHDVIAEAGLSSESEGEGRSRHVVVLPAQD